MVHVALPNAECSAYGTRVGWWVPGLFFCVPKWASDFSPCIQSFSFRLRNIFLVLGGWVVWLLDSGGGVRQITPPPRPPPVDQHIPDSTPADTPQMLAPPLQVPFCPLRSASPGQRPSHWPSTNGAART